MGLNALQQFYYITADTKAGLRSILRPLINQYALRYSSLFALEDTQQHPDSLANANNLVLFMIITLNETGTSPDIYSSQTNHMLTSCSFTPDPATAKEVLINWGISQLCQNTSYIDYEVAANVKSNGLQIKHTARYITRLFSTLTETMVIINHTPDSFSEHGLLYQQKNQIVTFIKAAIANGASIIDIGAESTRDNATPISVQEEILRLQRVIELVVPICVAAKVKISIDSYKPETIIHFLGQIDIVNDVSGSLSEAILTQIAKSGKQYLCMHSLTIPANKDIILDLNSNPVTTIIKWAQAKINLLTSLGFSKEQIIIDIGIGYNKSPVQDWFLLANADKFHELGVAILVGHSRKSFLQRITSIPASQRDLQTTVISNHLSTMLIDYIRIHNPDMHCQIATTYAQLAQ